MSILNGFFDIFRLAAARKQGQYHGYEGSYSYRKKQLPCLQCDKPTTHSKQLCSTECHAEYGRNPVLCRSLQWERY